MKNLFTFILCISITVSVKTQTINTNKTSNILNTLNLDSSSVSGKLRINNKLGESILEVNDEGNGGSIYLPTLTSITDPVKKLYNLGNTLYWDNKPLTQSNNGNGWILENNYIFLSDPNHSVGIGTENPLQKLHIENGSILTHGNIDWFPGLIVKNEVGRSVLDLIGTPNANNYSSTEIVMQDLTNGNTWSLLHTNNNSLSFVNHTNAANFKSPLNISFGAPTNSLNIGANGNIGIGTVPNEYKLAVAGSIISEEIIVKLQSNWPDYVFEQKYDLPDLSKVEKYIIDNQHLKGIPSASEINKNGINISDIQVKLLQKIEELTLYIIRQEKQIDKLTEELNSLNKAVGAQK